MTNMTKEVSAGIIIYRMTNEGPKFLLLYHRGRYWNFPKGKLNEGEKNFFAALREVYEETGIGKKDLIFVDWFKAQDRFTFIKNKEKVFKVVSYYLAETHKISVRLSPDPEQQGYGWFLYRDALHMLIHQNLKKNLKNAYDLIIRKKGIQSRQADSAGKGGYIRRRFRGNKAPQSGARDGERTQ